VLNPFDSSVIVQSVRKTRRLVVVDGGTRTAGFAAEVIASVAEHVAPSEWLAAPARVTLPDAPAPSSRVLEAIYYPTAEHVVAATMSQMRSGRPQPAR
jgi:pyruvate dehydrogenase E1 component beta subunit